MARKKKEPSEAPRPARDLATLHGGVSHRLMLVRDVAADWLPNFACAEDIHAYARPYFGQLVQEEFWVLACDIKNRVEGASMVSRGILDSSLVHPREVFGFAVASAAATVVLLHNHPSGDPEPSGEDRALTNRLKEAGEIMGIPVLDHVVIGRKGFVSFAQRGWL